MSISANSAKFPILCYLWPWLGPSGSVAICCLPVLPVLWMTLCLHVMSVNRLCEKVVLCSVISLSEKGIHLQRLNRGPDFSSLTRQVVSGFLWILAGRFDTGSVGWTGPGFTNKSPHFVFIRYYCGVIGCYSRTWHFSNIYWAWLCKVTHEYSHVQHFRRL